MKRHVPFVTENMLQEIADEFESNGIFLIAWEQLKENMCLSGAHKTSVLTFIIINLTSPYTLKQ